MAKCQSCQSPVQPDRLYRCAQCEARRDIRVMQSDHFAEDDVMLPLVAGGQGRHPEDITDAAVALRDLVLWGVGGLGVILVGWMVWRAVQ